MARSKRMLLSHRTHCYSRIQFPIKKQKLRVVYPSASKSMYTLLTCFLVSFIRFLCHLWIDFPLYIRTELPAEEGNHYHHRHSCHFMTNKFLWLIIFPTNSFLCRQIFMGACPRTVWRPTCSNSSAGCVYIFCKYTTSIFLQSCWECNIYHIILNHVDLLSVCSS